MTRWQKAIREAEARGHQLENDPPHALSSMARRTCSVCGRAVLGNARTAYGSALETDCTRKTDEKSSTTT